MGTDYDVFEPEPKPATKAKAEPGDVPPNGLTPEEFAAVRRDIRRMWRPEPEETRG
jgi:hypothetical protein